MNTLPLTREEKTELKNILINSRERTLTRKEYEKAVGLIFRTDYNKDVDEKIICGRLLFYGRMGICQNKVIKDADVCSGHAREELIYEDSNGLRKRRGHVLGNPIRKMMELVFKNKLS